MDGKRRKFNRKWCWLYINLKVNEKIQRWNLEKRSKLEKKYAKTFQVNVNNTGKKNERENNSQNVHAK